MSMSPRQRRESLTADSDYARLDEHVYAFADQYTGGRDIYYTGACKSCGLSGISIDKYSPSYGKQPDDWVREHNQAYHEAETRPHVKIHQPRLELNLCCGHTVKGFFKDGQDMVCSSNLHIYEGKWHFEQPLYVCDVGHYNLMSADLDSADVMQQLDELVEEIGEDVEEWQIEQQMRELKARKRRKSGR